MAANLMNINSCLLDDKDHTPIHMNVKVTTSRGKTNQHHGSLNSGAFYDRGRSPPTQVVNGAHHHLLHPNDNTHFH